MSKIELINDSCANQVVDVVVNAANRYLYAGDGICGVLFTKAGYKELTEECKKISTPLKDGDAVFTGACNMKNCKGMIHAVGPDFNTYMDYNTLTIKDEGYLALENAYYNALLVLKEQGYHSISFPLISSGIFGGDLENPPLTSAESAYNAYQKFINKYPLYEIEMLLCCYGYNEYLEAKKVFPDEFVRSLEKL